MTSKTANSHPPKTPKLVVFFIYPDFKLLDLTGPLQVFSDARDQQTSTPAYDIKIVSLSGGETRSDTGLSIASQAYSRSQEFENFTLVVVGGNGAETASRNTRLIDIISQLSYRAERTASVCTGAFILAASNVLDGRKATTHWQHCDDLALAYPNIKVQADPIYIKDGNIWTSAGVTAGIDLALAIVNEDFGKHTALSLARSLVTYVVRPGGQSQFSIALGRQMCDRSNRFEDLHKFIISNLDKDLRVEALAKYVNMSPRNFARIYANETGMTPAKAVEAFRTEIAQQLLEETKYSIAHIAQICGFGDDERMRRTFVKILKVSPLDYRLRFRCAILEV